MSSPNNLQPRQAFDAGAFAAGLRKARRDRKWSQAELAEKSGVARETIGRIENGSQPHAQTVLDLIRSRVFAGDEPLLKGWEAFPDAQDKDRSLRARAARRTAGLTLEKVAASAGVSTATLSHFERSIVGPTKIVGPRSKDRGEKLISAKYAKCLGFKGAADMRAYIEADDPKPWLDAIAKKFNKEMPPAALLPTAPLPDPA